MDHRLEVRDYLTCLEQRRDQGSYTGRRCRDQFDLRNARSANRCNRRERDAGEGTSRCIIAAHLTKAEARTLRLCLNRSQERGEWSFESLKLEIEELIVDDEVPIELSGFTVSEVDQILMEDEVAAPLQGPQAGARLTKELARNTASLINYGERYRSGERISSAFVEATVTAAVSKRFAKKQQMRWTRRGAHLLLQARTKTLDGTLRSTFERWYQGLANENLDHMIQAKAA